MTTVISIVEGWPNRPIGIWHGTRSDRQRTATQRRWLHCRAVLLA